jgi:AcrR family transcriptional regulator
VDTTRKKGRQAEAARNDLKVLDAAREVFTTQGWDAPVAAVAERAGVGMGSLYRRYGSKSDLLRYLCMLSMQQNIEAATNALALDDPWASLASYVRACVALGVGAFAPLAGTIEVTEEMVATAKKSNRLLTRIAARAHQSGQLRSDVTDTDIWWLIEQFSRHSANPYSADDPNVRARILAISLDGLRPQSGPPLPGPAPDRHANARRWINTARRPSIAAPSRPSQVSLPPSQ